MSGSNSINTSGGGGGSGGSSKFSLCQASSFCADNELVTIVPSFTYRGRIPFMSWTTTSSTSTTSNNKGKTNDVSSGGGGVGGYVVGPFVSGVPTEVPLWVAKTLHSRRLAQVDVPDWLTPQRLKLVIKEERTSPLLSKRLPFYYYEISLALKWLVDPQCQVLLQDLSSLRLDKLRQNFQEISRDTLEEPQGLVGDDDDEEDDDDDEDAYYGNNNRNGNKTNNNNSNDENGAGRDVLPTIDITGIASYELNKVGPFFQRAFSDYGYLTTRMSEQLYEKYHVDHDDDEDEEEDEQDAEEDDEDDIPTRMEDEDEDVTEERDHEGYDDDDDDNYTDRGVDKSAAASDAAGGGGTTRRIVGGRSRLRRFR